MTLCYYFNNGTTIQIKHIKTQANHSFATVYRQTITINCDMEMPEDIFNKMNIATGKLLLRNLSVGMSYSMSGFCKYMKDLKCEHFN